MSFLSTEFTWAGTNSDDKDIRLVRVGEDTITQVFSSGKSLIREHIKFRGDYYQGADKSIYNLSMKIAKMNIEDPFIPEDRMELLRWLIPDDEFHAFTCEGDFPGLEFWVQFTKVQFVTNPIGQGYYELEAESNHPYPFSEMYSIEYDLSDNLFSEIIEIPNNCNAYKYFTPNVMEFTLVNDETEFSLKNLTSNGDILTFSGLDLLETVAINSNQEILSSTGRERISKFNFGFNALKLPYGLNRLEITGKCKLQFKLQYPVQI